MGGVVVLGIFGDVGKFRIQSLFLSLSLVEKLDFIILFFVGSSQSTQLPKMY